MTVAPDDSLEPHQFIAENAGQAAYWAELAREAVVIRDHALLNYATRKAAAYGRAFVGAVKDLLETYTGGVLDPHGTVGRKE